MKKQNGTLLLLLTASLVFTSCSTDRNFKKNLEQTLLDNPDIVMKVIEKNPEKFVTVLQGAVQASQKKVANQRQLNEQKKLQAAFDNPLKPNITKNDVVVGPKNAPITLVEYSDFECPFCKRGYDTVQALKKKYKGKIRFIYKHLPLSFHKQAMISSKYYEAIRLQGETKATKFHDLVFENQKGISGGKKFLDKMAKKAGANLKKLTKDLDNSKVSEKVEEDMLEAAKFGIQGTPGFIINGIPVKGAYPPAHFTGIIKELEKRGKLKL
ncbi:MAG: thioredoxin domain-containing protein [Bacteriovoracaceae bacterium]|nr:thioredoxin domain-containing protein [Bacteriovoracaceae bacterium]